MDLGVCSAGNIGSSETVYFTVDVPESFPVVPVIAVVAVVVGAGLMVYFKKRKH
jgi:hypothetical protein